ncbi:MAG: hypothetical protein ACFFAS_20090 [Promethearchaeota archaeon]
MVLIEKNLKDVVKYKQKAKNAHKCPFCKEKIEIGVEYETFNKLKIENRFPYPHIVLHGNPLHALICYIDSHLTVRSITVIKSVEISRNSETFMQIMNKWANPY